MKGRLIVISSEGFLLAATDSETGHVNGTHIEFAQRGELPTKQQPVLVVYTDQGKNHLKQSFMGKITSTHCVLG